jgi:hypothetical protein
VKYIFLALLFAAKGTVLAQNDGKALLKPYHFTDTVNYEIVLSRELDQSRMGVWNIGDYEICIDMKTLEDVFLTEYRTVSIQFDSLPYAASVGLLDFRAFAEKYLLVAKLLNNGDDGFDLRSIVLYYGPDNIQQNTGNSIIVELIIRQLVERGAAAVYYKGNRIYNLQKQILSDDFRAIINVYYDQPDDSIFLYVGGVK